MTTPPVLALWVLERCKPGSCREALIGDLLEEIARGRSRVWIWQQVLAFCGFAVVDNLRDWRPRAHLIALALAVGLIGGALLGPSAKVLGTWAVFYVAMGTASLFGDMITRAFDARPILFPFSTR